MASSDHVLNKPDNSNPTDAVELKISDFQLKQTREELQNKLEPQLGQSERIDDIETQVARINDDVGSSFIIGMVYPWVGLLSKVPSSWLLCDGSALSRTQYRDLFETIGTQWGTGNGSTTFNIPNFVDSFLQGVATASTEPGTTGGATAKSNTFTSGNASTASVKEGSGSQSVTTASHTHDTLVSFSDIRPKYAEVAWIIKVT